MARPLVTALVCVVSSKEVDCTRIAVHPQFKDLEGSLGAVYYNFPHAGPDGERGKGLKNFLRDSTLGLGSSI